MKIKTEEKDFDYYIDEYLYYCQSRRLRPKTLNSYEQALRLFERWCSESEGLTSPSGVKEQTIRRYVCELQERGKYSFYADEERTGTNCPERRRDFRQPVSITTINNYIRNLRAFFNWYAEDLPATKNPMKKIRQLENERQPREYLTDEEVRKLLGGFDKSYYPEARDYMIVLLLMDTGMRLGECLQLELSHVHLQERSIEIPSELTKGRKGRSVFFSIKTSRELQKWLRYKDRYCESNYLFPVKATGLPLQVTNFETNFKKYIKRTGVTKQISPHALRNNFAKRCIMAGMNIYTLSRILGHSSVTVTEQAYLDLTDNDIKMCYQNFSPVERMN